MKTPEEMAREFANDSWGEQEWGAYCGFLAGYKAAMESTEWQMRALNNLDELIKEPSEND